MQQKPVQWNGTLSTRKPAFLLAFVKSYSRGTRYLRPTPSPQQIFFFCGQDPADGCGGETPLVKNSELLSTLDPDIVRRFEEKRVRYVRYFPDKSNGEYVNWQHVYQTDNGEVSTDVVLLFATIVPTVYCGHDTLL